MRRLRLDFRFVSLLAAAVLLAAVPTAWGQGRQQGGQWKQVHPHWQRAYVFSFRSPDLLSREADERWGRDDGRLDAGGILTDFPRWLEMHHEAVAEARRQGRPILLSLHTHGGFGTGLVTYGRGLKTAEVVNYPWLIRTLDAAGLNAADVTVAVDTCNAHAIAAHQLRPDLVPNGVSAWAPFARWRAQHPARKALPLGEAYRLFAQDRVRLELAPAERGSRANVNANPFTPLTTEERRGVRARLYGPRGVILATPAFFNLLRLGPEPQGTLTADLLKARLDARLYDGLLAQNKAEFARFREFAFLEAAGPGPVLSLAEAERLAGPAVPREQRVETGRGNRMN
jgi:hypothetical protein